jgi:peroxiredoxin Q/BCP
MLIGGAAVMVVAVLVVFQGWFMGKALEPGEKAPAIVASAHDGQRVALAEYVGKKVVVLYFYPMDNTAVCTAEACAFRDAYEDFTKAGAVVIGVSGDSDTSHRDFAAKQRLPFLLVSDKDGSIRKAFGVSNTFGLVPKRVTFVIDKQGVIRHVFSALFTADKHVQEARRIVEELGRE